MLDNIPNTKVNNTDGTLLTKTYRKTQEWYNNTVHKYNLVRIYMSYPQSVPERLYYVDAPFLWLLHPETYPHLKRHELQLREHRSHLLLLHVYNLHNYHYLNLKSISVLKGHLIGVQILLKLRIRQKSM